MSVTQTTHLDLNRDNLCLEVDSTSKAVLLVSPTREEREEGVQMAGIARLGTYALDCPDPRELAAFYGEITGWEIEPDSDDEWVTLSPPDGGGIQLAFQRADEYAPPKWPGAEAPQQAHLDFYVPDLDEGERQVLKLGARKAEYQPGTTFRVYLDPVGHPFCLCVG